MKIPKHRFNRQFSFLYVLVIFYTSLTLFMQRAVAQFVDDSIKTPVNPNDPAENFLATEMVSSKPTEMRVSISHMKEVENSENCLYITDVLNNLSQKLPSSFRNIMRVLQSDIALVCEPKTEEYNARFIPKLRAIFFPEHPSEDAARYNGNTMAHEMTHAAKFLNHMTPSCNLNNPILVRQLREEGIWAGRYQYPEEIASAPIWPPTKANLTTYIKQVLDDIKEGEFKELLTLHYKNYLQSISREEKAKYRAYCDLLNDTVVDNYLFQIKAKGDELNVLRKKKNLPLNFIDEWVIYQNLQWVKVGNNPKGQLVGQVADKVSQFIRKVIIGATYHQSEDLLQATTEMHAYIVSGSSDLAKRKFFPRLSAMDEQDEACCVRGEVSACHPLAN